MEREDGDDYVKEMHDMIIQETLFLNKKKKIDESYQKEIANLDQKKQKTTNKQLFKKN